MSINLQFSYRNDRMYECHTMHYSWQILSSTISCPDSKVYGANMGPIWQIDTQVSRHARSIMAILYAMTNVSKNHKHGSWFVVLFMVWCGSIITMCFRVTSLALGQSFVCPSASGETLKWFTKSQKSTINRQYSHSKTEQNITMCIPNGKVYGANVGSIWGQQAPCGPHVGLMNFCYLGYYMRFTQYEKVHITILYFMGSTVHDFCWCQESEITMLLPWWPLSMQ